jgi:hypothetical protein
MGWKVAYADESYRDMGFNARISLKGLRKITIFFSIMIDDERTYTGTRLLTTKDPNLPLHQPVSCEEIGNRTSLKRRVVRSSILWQLLKDCSTLYGTGCTALW